MGKIDTGKVSSDGNGKWSSFLSIFDEGVKLVEKLPEGYKTFQEAQEIRARIATEAQKEAKATENARLQLIASHEEKMANIEKERQKIVNQDNANKRDYELRKMAFEFFSMQYSQFKTLEDMLTPEGKESLDRLNTIIHDLLKDMISHSK